MSRKIPTPISAALAADWAMSATEPVNQPASANVTVSPTFTARKKSTLRLARMSDTSGIVPDIGSAVNTHRAQRGSWPWSWNGQWARAASQAGGGVSASIFGSTLRYGRSTAVMSRSPYRIAAAATS